MIDYKQLHADVDFLAPYQQADGTEWGEMILCLCQLASRSDYVSEELAALVVKEIADNVEYVKANARVVETTETFTRTVVDIEWDDR